MFLEPSIQEDRIRAPCSLSSLEQQCLLLFDRMDLVDLELDLARHVQRAPSFDIMSWAHAASIRHQCCYVQLACPAKENMSASADCNMTN